MTPVSISVHELAGLASAIEAAREVCLRAPGDAAWAAYMQLVTAHSIVHRMQAEAGALSVDVTPEVPA